MNELLKYADWLDENIKDEQFNFKNLVTEYYPNTNCGSICCALGWLPTYSTRFRWGEGSDALIVIAYGVDNPYRDFGEEVEKFFGMPRMDIANLFSGNYFYNQNNIEDWGDYPVCYDDCTIKQLTDAIRHYVEIKS